MPSKDSTGKIAADDRAVLKRPKQILAKLDEEGFLDGMDQFTTPFSSPMNVSPAITPSFPSSPVLPELLPSLQVTPRDRSRVHYVEPTPQKETPTLKTSLHDSDIPESKRCELHPFHRD
ncbi:hypothetical protein BLNAU_3053 [Blattamonas nauphoetae]|uniref:Uncharacterized protein n=1 Tax=Blattamonas nauphoetae TaxID=2049346 RepID=A0ABQ9YE07_9EUKA|nr:hypothetical protein BLNAU_3053 [Blattamonas nauphoetae]